MPVEAVDMGRDQTMESLIGIVKTADLDPKSDEKLSLMYLIKQETEGDFPHNEINTN